MFFSLSRVRKPVPGGVKRLKSLFKNNCFQAGPENAIVIDIMGELQRELSSYFQSLGVLEENIGDRIQSQHNWYGIVDGKRTWLAIMKLRSGNASVWDSFCWPVTRLKSIPELPTGRELARSINDIHEESAYIEATFFDKLYEIWQEYDLLCVIRGDRKLQTGFRSGKSQ